MRARTSLLILLALVLWGRGVHGRGSDSTWVSPCTLDVVLVTFKDTSATGNSNLDYHLHDRPYGTNEGQQAADRYKLADFERLFNGGYDAATVFLGDTVTVANSDTLPAVFGSVRAYYDSMSLDRAAAETEGKFQLHARLINADDGDYPRWIQLPHTKEYYHEIDNTHPDSSEVFWDDAYAAAADAVSCWRSGTRHSDGETCESISGYAMELEDLPNDDFSKDRRIRHKVAYVYSGRTYTAKNKRRNNNGQPGLLHPQGDDQTDEDLEDANDVGYRYVMGERRGWGHDDDDIDEFASIGTHVHEIGHLLGLNHGEGGWTGTNPHTQRDSTWGAANFVGWGIMQSATEGPQLSSNGYHQGYGSCPLPINPFYRMDLGWLDPIELTEREQDYALALGSVHRIAANKRPSIRRAHRDTVLLERRSHHGFGRYVSFHEFADQDPGLLIWRRALLEPPILIVADERRITDARNQQQNPNVPVYQDQLSDPFPVFTNAYSTYTQPAVAAVYAHTDSVGLRQTTDWKDYPGNLGFALTDIRRRSEMGNDTLSLDVQLNYWAGSLDREVQEVWGDGMPEWDVDTVYVGGDVTVPEGTTLTIEPGTVVQLAGSGDMMGTGHSTTKAEMLVYGKLIAEGVTFTAAAAGQTWGGLVFYGDAVNHTTLSALTGCTIEDALYGVRLRTVGWTVGGSTVEAGNTFRRCPYGVLVDGAGHDPRGNLIRHNRFEDCPTSIQVSNAFNTTIQQNLITGSTMYGLQVFGARSDSTLVLNNTLYAGSGGGKGVYFSNESAGTIRSTIASGFPQGGAGGMGVGSVTLDYYLSDNYGGTEMSGTVDSTRRALRSDPQFEDPGNNDYTLKADSPALDLGDPAATGLHANDGDRIDLGRYGGTAMADTASADLAREDYFYKGQVSGWTAASGASGSWSGDATQGTYKVTGVSGISKSYTSVDGSEYTLETRLKFSGDEGKVLYMQANNNETYRVDLMAVNDKVRLSVGQAGLYWGPSVTINANVWYSVRVQVKDTKVSVWLNGALIHDQVGLDATPDGFVGVGSYGSTHTAEVDYFLALQVADGASGGGGGALVEDQFNDGATDGWGLHSGTWSESGGHRTVSVDGEAVSYLSTGFDASQYPVYTVKVRLRMGGVEGKVVHRNANQSSAARVDLMSGQDQVRVIDVGVSNTHGHTLNTNQWYVCEVEVDDTANTINVWVDGHAANTDVPMTATPNGYVGVGSYGSTHTTDFDYLQVFGGQRAAKAVALMEVAPVSDELLSNYPNPFNPTTTMRYQVRHSGPVKLVLYNVLGQVIRTLVNEHQSSGAQQVVWDGRDEQGRQLVSGVYVYRLEMPSYVEVRKMTLLK